MPHWTVSPEDRDPATGRIMADAQERAAAREAAAPAEPTAEQAAAPRQRKLSNRRGYVSTDQPAAPIRPQLPASTYRQLAISAAIVAVMALAAFLALGRSEPAPATTTRATTTDHGPRTTDHGPTAAPAQIDAYAAPDGALLGPIPAGSALAYQDSRHPGWAGVQHGDGIVWVKAEPPEGAGDLAPHAPAAVAPAPAPAQVAPAPIYIEVAPPCDVAVNPRYAAQEDVYDGARPLGQVVGVSCESQADAQQHADDAAAAIRAAQPTAARPVSPQLVCDTVPTHAAPEYPREYNNCRVIGETP